jgi:hypothetical protein
MDTYVLVGNPSGPDGMDSDLWERNCEHASSGDGPVTSWSMSTKATPAGAQIVIIRTGSVRGVIGFGHRYGNDTVLSRGRREYPIRLMNMRSLNDAPFMSRKEMEGAGAWRRKRDGGFASYYGSGTKFGAELPEVEACCERLLGFSLATLCSRWIGGGDVSSDSGYDTEAVDIEVIEQRTDLSPTAKKQLIDARRGQGRFRESVLAQEPSCRVTRISASEHLRASHIKPWRLCTDAERLDGSNGLMLSPHVDHLFDRGYISFSGDGGLVISNKLDANVVGQWNLTLRSCPRPFSWLQDRYLAFHREQVFKGR